ncbi:MAG: holin [Firmicutes bacterium HGW-Firmicutes-15]|nr:MAG: holin [Firmicutes bacterium HGW-Firmicutes-15]
MENEFIELCYNALGILVPALCLIMIELLRRKLGLEKMRKIQSELETKQELASLAIRFVEHVNKDQHGQEKYEQAATWLVARVLERGIKANPDEIKGLLEAALRMAKDEFGEQWAKQEKEDPGKLAG